MAIQKLITPKYKLKLPSTGKQITYRPMLVKEEKILHMGMEAQESGSMLESLMTVLDNCIETKDIDIGSLPSFDVEYLMIIIRSKSIGEVVAPYKTCEACDTEIPVECDIADIKVERNKNHANKIQLTDDIGIIMKYPSIADMSEMGKDDKDEVDIGISLATNCIEQIYDKDSVYDANKISSEEMDEFISSLTSMQFQEIIKFFTTMPYLKIDIEAKCPTCGHINEIKVRGLENFFG